MAAKFKYGHIFKFSCNRSTLLHASVVQAFTTGRMHTQHAEAIKRSAHSVSLHAPIWTTWLKCKPLCTTGVCSRSLHTQSGKGTWTALTESGFYIRTSIEHYRCHQAWITDTRHVWIADTIFFKHKYLTMPTMSPAKVVLKAADDLEQAIVGVLPQSVQTAEALQKLMEQFNG